MRGSGTKTKFLQVPHVRVSGTKAKNLQVPHCVVLVRRRNFYRSHTCVVVVWRRNFYNCHTFVVAVRRRNFYKSHTCVLVVRRQNFYNSSYLHHTNHRTAVQYRPFPLSVSKPNQTKPNAVTLYQLKNRTTPIAHNSNSGSSTAVIKLSSASPKDQPPNKQFKLVLVKCSHYKVTF